MSIRDDLIDSLNPILDGLKACDHGNRPELLANIERLRAELIAMSPYPPPSPSMPVTREHALEHLLIGLIRKYGDNGSSVFLEPETTDGNFTVSLSFTEGGVLIEVLDVEEE